MPISLVLCSSARRARETVELVEPGGEVRIEDQLYGASAEELLDRLRLLAEDEEVVMLVAHNPAIQELAVKLSHDAPEVAGRKFPTGALATFSVEGSWKSLGPAGTQLLALITPRELG